MLDKSINSALLALRAQISREGLDGLDHVEALLVLRGIDPADHRVKRKIPHDSLKQGEAKRMILETLRTGPKRPRDMVPAFVAARPEWSRDVALICIYRAVRKMRDRGVVVSDGGVWRLA